MQEDALMQTSTPREALEFSARLRLHFDRTKEEIDGLVCSTLTSLGLDSCADVMIGGALIKGISGGQRKRTSIGVEIITDPALLFLDEPTSGLDSFSAQSCVKLFSAIAKRNAAVLCTIHQPSSDVFELFDVAIFLVRGSVLYAGPVAALTKYFAQFGYDCPLNYNPADFVMLLMQTESAETLTKSGMVASAAAQALLLEQEAAQLDATPLRLPPPCAAPLLTQIAMLALRETRDVRRDTAALAARFGISIFLSIVFGVIFFGAGDVDDSIEDKFQSHFGSLTFITISQMFGASQPVMLSFPFERPMFLREYSTGTYGAPAYFLCKALWELPLSMLAVLVQQAIMYPMIGFRGNFGYIVLTLFGLASASSSVAVLLGCLAPDVKKVTELSTLLFVPQLLFAGFFIRINLIPPFMRWAQYLCSLKYALNLMMIIEFHPSAKNCAGAAHDNCVNLLEHNGVTVSLWWLYVLLIAALFFALRIMGARILMEKAKRFY